MEQSGLRQVLGLPAVTFVVIGFMIGGGVFVFSGVVLKIAGPALPWCYALAAVPVFLSMLPVVMLGSALPASGASYRYVSRMVSPGAAFVAIWVYALGSFLGQIPLYAIGCATYLRPFWPQIPITWFAAGLVTCIFVINVLGVRLAAQIQGALVVTLIAALVFFVGCGASVFESDRLLVPTLEGGSTLLLGTALLSFTYFGGNGVIELGGEIRDPGRIIPRAFFIAFPLVATLYVAVALITVGAAPQEDLRAAAEPLLRVMEIAGGRASLFFFAAAGAVVALVTTLNALFLVGTRSLLIMVEDGLLPQALGQLHQRFRTPARLLTGIWILSLAGIVSGLGLQTLAAYATLGGLAIFLPLQIAALRFARLYPQQYENAAFRLRRPTLWLCAGVGMVMVLFFGLVIFIDLETPEKVGGGMAMTLVGLLVYRLRQRHLRHQGSELAAEEGKKE